MSSKQPKKYIYYTNGEINLRVEEKTPCPNGFHRGRVHYKLSPEKAKIASEKRKTTCLKKYNDTNFNNKQKRIQTNIEKYGCEFGFQAAEIKEKIKQTNLEKYGVENQFQRVSMLQQVMLKEYNVNNISQTKECKEKVKQTNLKKYNSTSFLNSEAMINLMQKKYKVKHYAQTKEFLERQYNTKKQNKSFTSSKIENKYFRFLIEKYGEENVETQYILDPRYPFYCDFYIKTLDLFIELNLHWTHGQHLFNPSSIADQQKLANWQEKSKSSKYYKNAIYTWTVRDVLKHQIAKENNLNYKVYYTEKELEN